MPGPRNVSCSCVKCIKKAPEFRMVTADLHRRHLTDYGASHLTPPDILKKYNLKPRNSKSQMQRPRAAASTGSSVEREQRAEGSGLADNGAALTAPVGAFQYDNLGAALHGDFDDEGEGNGSLHQEDDQQDQEMQPVPPQTQPAPRPLPDRIWTKVSFDADDYDSEDERQKAIPFHPPAYARNEPPSIRIAYLQAVMNNVFKHVSVQDTNDNLAASLMAIEAERGSLPSNPAPVKTLASVKQRLGVDPDPYIIQYACCPVCWKHYRPSEMNELPAPNCVVPDCSGIIYQEEKDDKGKLKRIAVKISPQVSLIQSLRRIVHRKGFRKLVRDSRDTPAHQNDDPNFVMKDLHDGKMWHDLKTGIQREHGDCGAVRDVPCPGMEEKPLTSHRFGLHVTINTDWFGALDNRPHSCGPVYLSIADLPREQRYLQVNTICVAITPGPKEPTNEQMVHIMEPTVNDLARLKNGVKMDMYDDDDKETVTEDVYVDVVCDLCDSPGARKFAGFAGHSADFHPCIWCKCTMMDTKKHMGYVPSSFQMKDNAEILRQKFRSKGKTAERQKEIVTRHGVQYAAMDSLPGWRPALQTPVDPMHCIFLGIVAALFNLILIAAHMFGGIGGDDSPKMRFERSLNSVQWPSHITRLPKNLGTNQTVQKADEWRQLITIAPVILWLTWRDPDDSIPDTEPPTTASEKIDTTHSRKRLSLYNAILYLCGAVRLLTTKTITMAQAAVGQQYLVNYCQRMIMLGVELTINHHLAMHMEDFIRLFGPVYAWWLFAYERFNGMLEKVKLNGHDGGRMELTMLRNWVQTHLIYDLSCSLPDDAAPYERLLLTRMIRSEGRGSMLHEIAVYQSEDKVGSVSLPKRCPRLVNLHKHTVTGVELEKSVYEMLLEHAQLAWPDLHLRREFSTADGTTFVGARVARRIPYVKKDGVRYGSRGNRRTKADSYAFIRAADSTRVPIELLDLFLLEISPSGSQDNGVKHQHVCALVRRFKTSSNVPALPWDHFSSILGIHTSFADEYHEPEVISAAAIDSPLALIRVKHLTSRRELAIAISFDHVATEPGEEWGDDEDDGY